MRLKKHTKTTAFLAAVNRCSGDVILDTAEGDSLNLKSQLCRYIFAVASSNASFFESATVTCSESSDYTILRDFLEESGEQSVNAFIDENIQ